MPIRRFCSRLLIALIVCGTVSSAAVVIGAEEQSDPFSTKPDAKQNLPVSAKILRYTGRVIEKYDANGDGQLQPSEWTSMRGDPLVIDRDRDGRITPEEFSQHVARYGRYRRILLITPESPDETPQAYETGTTAVEEETLRRGKKFYIPDSRLPKGLSPAFFARDVDGDGQLTRSEFAPDSTPEQLDRFKKLDANLDGVVTAREYVRGSQTKSAVTNPEPTTPP